MLNNIQKILVFIPFDLFFNHSIAKKRKQAEKRLTACKDSL
ncbi:hypothetical protein ACIN8IBEIGE_160281 [Acinetobacter sp. 8I-beige]|nr:hypothetical protein ACIN8IBEIGE_160281 [Acinetobacter sp. 8I-beige]